MATQRIGLGIAGRIGAGKTTLARGIEEALGFRNARYSKVLAQWHPEASGNRDRLREIGRAVMEGGLQPELNRRMLETISDSERCVVDGLRHQADFDALSAEFRSGFRVIYLECPIAERWRRVSGQAGRFPSRQAFDEADADPVESRISSLAPHAHFAPDWRLPANELLAGVLAWLHSEGLTL